MVEYKGSVDNALQNFIGKGEKDETVFSRKSPRHHIKYSY